jgi:tetratricopeptide (TPR) repeat protein/TolB-like protein
MGGYRVFLALLVTMLLLGAASWVFLADTDLSSRVPSFETLVVLPLDTSAEHSGSQQLAMGIGFELRRRLQILEAVQCFSLPEVYTWQDAGETRFELARRLGAEIVVSGTALLESSRVTSRVVIEDARHHRLIAEIEIDGSTERIFDFQRNLTQAVLDSLGLVTRSSERSQLKKDPTRSLMAWDFFLQGQWILRDHTNPRDPFFAVDLFRRALQHDPDFALAHVALSEALWITYLRTGQPETLLEAELEVRSALSINPTMSLAPVVLAKLLLTNNPTRAARVFPNPELTGLSKPDEAARHVAIEMLQIGEIGQAETSWQSAIQLGPDLWLNWFSLGQFLQRSGRFGEAERAFAEAAARASGEVVWPLESLTRLKLINGDLTGAILVFESLDESLAGIDTVRQVGAAYDLLGQPDDSLRLYRWVLEQDSRDPFLYQEIGDILHRQNEDDQAREHYLLGLRLVEDRLGDQPSDTELQLHLALLAAKTGDCARALPLAATLGRHLQKSIATYRDLTTIFALCQKTEMAIDTLRTALIHGLSPEVVQSVPEFRDLLAMAEVKAMLSEVESIPPSP